MLLVPYSIVHLLDISGIVVSFEAIVFAYVCWFSLGMTHFLLIICSDDLSGVIDVLLLYNTFRILGPVLLPLTETEKGFSRRHHDFECLTLRSSTSQNEKISQYRDLDFFSPQLGRQSLTETSLKSFVFDSPPLLRDQSLTMPRPLSSLASDDNFTITPPPLASLSFRSDNGRRDRESSLLAAGIPARPSQFATALPQSPGIYGGFVPTNEHEIVRQHSTQTVEHQNPSRSRITTWTKWTPRSLRISHATQGQARLDV